MPREHGDPDFTHPWAGIPCSHGTPRPHGAAAAPFLGVKGEQLRGGDATGRCGHRCCSPEL